MPKNLTEKLSILLEDLESLPKFEAIRICEAFVNQELNFLEIERKITRHDLTLIRSSAISEMQNMKIDMLRTETDDSLRTYCYVHAILGFLRKEGLIKFTMSYDKK